MMRMSAMTALILAALTIGTARADDSSDPFREVPAKCMATYAATEDCLYAILRAGGTLVGPGWRMHCRQVKGRKILQLTVESLDQRGRIVGVFKVETAALEVDAGGFRLHTHNGVGVFEDGAAGTFDDRVFSMDLPRLP